ncbi:MAG: DUF4301 family protein [Nitrospirales bacterium]
MSTLTDNDQQHIQSQGISLQEIEQQLTTFRQGIPFTRLDRPCTIGDGITKFSATELEHYAHTFHEAMASGRVTKFVPASGAASRMFKILLTALEQTSTSRAQSSYEDLLSHGNNSTALRQFFQQLESFAFYTDLQTQLSLKGVTTQTQHWREILETLLHTPGLGYAHLPKGLLQFHQYSDHPRTPIEEHMHEGRAYAQDASGVVRMHFTVSPEHEEQIREHLTHIFSRNGNTDPQINITFSHQQSSTDTIAADLENQPFRDSNGKLVFRPGGHGALLKNLYDYQGDIVFIKNIDNVVPERLTDQPNLYKKALGGYLVTIQQQLFSYLNKLSHSHIESDLLNEIVLFAQDVVGITISKELKTRSVKTQQQFLFTQLNRPLRVCGMVPNSGEPGGGPFWVAHQDGTCTRQIVESSQVDSDSKEQQAILQTSTHFNPVDLVCAVKDFQGKTFDLPRFSDPNTGFISMKSYQGRDLQALELPGLWNGAMAFWNTIFIEVPALTFNPVKTVLDLLRPEHQPPQALPN